MGESVPRASGGNSGEVLEAADLNAYSPRKRG